MKVLNAFLACLFVIGLVAAVLFTVYAATVGIGGYWVVEDSVIIKTEEGRELRYERRTDPWFGFMTETVPVIVPVD